MDSVLLVDDDHLILDALSRVVEAAGVHCECVSGYAEAEKHIESAGKFSALIIDIWLGQHSGLDLMQKLIAKSDPPPVIAISGGGPGRTLEQAVAMADSLNAAIVLLKPFRSEELLDALRQVGVSLK